MHHFIDIYLVWFIVVRVLDELVRYVWSILYSKNLKKIPKREIESWIIIKLLKSFLMNSFSCGSLDLV